MPMCNCSRSFGTNSISEFNLNPRTAPLKVEPHPSCVEVPAVTQPYHFLETSYLEEDHCSKTQAVFSCKTTNQNTNDTLLATSAQVTVDIQSRVDVIRSFEIAKAESKYWTRPMLPSLPRNDAVLVPLPRTAPFLAVQHHV